MNYIGDALMTTPALERLAIMSEMPVDVIASPSALECLEGNPYVGKMIPRNKGNAAGRCAHLISTIRSGGYKDVAVLPSIPIYGHTARIAGASRIFVLSKTPPHSHYAIHLARSIERFYNLAKTDVTYTLNVGNSSRSYASSVFNQDNTHSQNIIFNIGASRPQKRWPIEFFAECAKLLLSTGAKIFVVGGNDDRLEASRLISILSSNRVVDLTGQTSIPELCGLIEGCDALVTGDTAALHIASALKTPVVALFGSTDPNQTGPIGDGKHLVLYNKLECSPCRSHPTCNGAFTCMRSITPESVVMGIRSMLLESIEVSVS
jgi:lipopolysaccharide heptosyltransferase II